MVRLSSLIVFRVRGIDDECYDSLYLSEKYVGLTTKFTSLLKIANLKTH